MDFFNEIIAVFWVLWLVYWWISAIGAKRSVTNNKLWQGAGFRIAIFVILLILIRIPESNQFFQTIHSLIFYSNPILDIIGVLLCASGLAFAIWARVHLGRNWGMPMTKREKPELVTSGPYRFIRHPIYTGIIFAMIGTAFVNGMIWLVAFVFMTVYFVYSIKSEEKFLSQEFSKEYKEYKKKTYALIPFIY